MPEKPILFKAPMVRAILEGRKTQTRRIFKARYLNKIITEPPGGMREKIEPKHCPYGQVGDKLWVRETWADVNTPDGPAICYRADGSYRSWEEFSKTFGPDYGAGPSMDYDAYPGEYVMWWEDLLNRDIHKEEGYRWRSPIHMFRWASRITLVVTDVRVQRLQDISGEDIVNEGIKIPGPTYNDPAAYVPDPWECFSELWDSINSKKYPWDSNPWVWAITFRVESK